VTVTWNITWSRYATIPELSTLCSSKSLNMAAVGGGVAGGCILLILNAALAFYVLKIRSTLFFHINTII